MDLITIVVFSFILGLSGAMAPGPLLTVTIAETARRGFIASVLLMVGHSLLELGIVLAFIFGLQKLLANYSVALTVSLLGGAFLLWMAYGLIFGVIKGQISLKLEADEEQQTRLHPISAGILVSMSNPYWFLWWVFVGGAYLLQARSMGLAAIVAFYIGHISSDFAWYLFVGILVAFGVSMGRQHKVMNVIYKSIMVACALFLIVIGIRFVNTGIGIARDPAHKVPEFKIEKRMIEKHSAITQPSAPTELKADG